MGFGADFGLKIKYLKRSGGMRGPGLSSEFDRVRVPSRHAPTLAGGGGSNSPRGSTAARPLFSLCVLGQGLGDSSIPAILSVFDAFGGYDLNLFIFPKTASGPGVSEKSGGHLERLLRSL